MLTISLITPSYQHAQFLPRTIDSVLNQSGEFKLEYSVRDGGSTDGTLSILESYRDRLSWTSEKDCGQIQAINQGLRSATGEIVGWLNSDDLLLPDALQRVAECFCRFPDCQWLHGDCLIIDTDDREIRRWVSIYKRRFARSYSFNSLLTRNFISQMTVFWRRSLLEQVGFLDPNFPLAFDYEYWLRLAKRWPPHYIPEPLAAFRWYDSSKSGANFEQQFAENERVASLHGLHATSRRLFKRLLNKSYIAAYRLASRVS